MRRILLAALAASLVAGVVLGPAAESVAAQEAKTLAFGGGIYDTAAFEDEGDFDAVEAGLVLRWPSRWRLGLAPMAGLSGNDDGAWWAYVGMRRPFLMGSRWAAVPSFGAAYYERGDSKPLGHEVEFRSGLEISRMFSNGNSLGLEFYHLSNAGLSKTNPGINSLWLVFAVPLSR